MARSLVEVQEEYNAVRAAYLKAVKAESYGISGRSVSRPRSVDLRKQMDQLAVEIERINAGGIVPRGITPVG